MANTLILNQNQVWNGTGTLTHTIATTGNYNVKFQCVVPQAPPVGDGAGSGTGLGSGAGGGGEGFTGGDLGTGHGGVGQGFGTGNGYPQPPSYGSNETLGAAVSSGLTVIVKNGASTIFTAPTFAVAQSAMQFTYGFIATAADVITVVLASSTSSDKGLNSVVSNVSIGQGLK